MRGWFPWGAAARSPVDEVMAASCINPDRVRPAFDAEPESTAARVAFEVALGEVALSGADEDVESKTRLQCLLVKWAAATLPRWTALMEEHPVTHKLVGDGWLPHAAVDFLKQEQERLEAEQKDIEAEADGLQPGWAEDLYVRAWRVHRHTMMRDAEGALRDRAVTENAKKGATARGAGRAARRVR